MKLQITKFLTRRWLIVDILALLVIIGSAVTIYYWPKPKKAEPPAPPVVASATVDTEPSEVPPPKDYKWEGDPTEPKQIQLPTIHAEGFVQSVGIDYKNEIAVPNNIFMAGWFNQTVKPGQLGLSVIDGHVDGRRLDGIFKNLVRMKSGDILRVVLGNGSIKRYKVFAIKSVITARAARVLFSQSPSVASQLNLITCGGTYNETTRMYDQRVIVSASLLK